MSASSVDSRTARRLILASASPRRQLLLREAGFVFEIAAADIDQRAVAPGLPARETAIRIAQAKAAAVVPRFPDRFILAADTVVQLGERILGKPDDLADARRMLQSLAGTTHQVITAVVLTCDHARSSRTESVISDVYMKPLSPEEIEKYVATGDWQGKAGGYGIQDADPFVTRIAGCATNIVGLPMTTTRRMLADAGIYPIVKN